MALEITDENLDLIKKNLIEIGDTIDESIVNQNTNIEKKEADIDKLIKDNVLNKVKTNLSSDEKKRYIEISKLFVKEWVTSIKKLQEEQLKKSLLSGNTPLDNKPKKKPSFELLSNLFKKKKQPEQPKKKSSKGFWTTALLFLTAAGGIYGIFNKVMQYIPDNIKTVFGRLVDSLAGLGQNLLNGLVDLAKEGLSQIWDWLLGALGLDSIVNFISDTWNTLTSGIQAMWNGVISIIKGVGDAIMSLPSKVWDWICDAIMAFIQPIIDIIKAAWDWICDAVIAVWDWICDMFKGWWEGLKAAFTSVIEFFTGIWDWITENFSFSKLWDGICKIFTMAIDNVKESIMLLFTGQWDKLLKKILGFVFGGFGKIFSWFTGGDDESNEEGQITETTQTNTTTEVQSNVSNIVDKQEDITVKDNLLDTVKDICDRINLFFSNKKDSFIDLSNELIKTCQTSFKDLFENLKKLRLQNVYRINSNITYHDMYDQSDKSTKTINNNLVKQYTTTSSIIYDYTKKILDNTYNDYTKRIIDNSVNNIDQSDRSMNNIINDYSRPVVENFNISYNSVDIPSIDTALQTLNNQAEEEIKLLEEQNKHLVNVINTVSTLNNKVEGFGKNKLKDFALMLMPTLGDRPTEYSPVIAIDMKATQQRHAGVFNV